MEKKNACRKKITQQIFLKNTREKNLILLICSFKDTDFIPPSKSIYLCQYKRVSTFYHRFRAIMKQEFLRCRDGGGGGGKKVLQIS